MRDFYDKNRQQILTVFLICAGIFFLFYWTSQIVSSKVKSYESSANAAYERLEKAAQLAVQVRQAEASKNSMNEGLLTFIQKTCGDLEMASKLVNLRPLTSSATLEHISMRLENLYYDEFIKFIGKIETFDNLHIKYVSFTKRYDNPNMIDASFEIVKS
ncbi:MAG: hypothetical protein IJD28_03380 [Deferribacterales bacterium]|nr:hypothetical protein [Deferribacterales bacterium]